MIERNQKAPLHFTISVIFRGSKEYIHAHFQTPRKRFCNDNSYFTCKQCEPKTYTSVSPQFFSSECFNPLAGQVCPVSTPSPLIPLFLFLSICLSVYLSLSPLSLPLSLSLSLSFLCKENKCKRVKKNISQLNMKGSGPE